MKSLSENGSTLKRKNFLESKVFLFRIEPFSEGDSYKFSGI